MSDPVILSYFDSLLRQSDIALLEKPNWLNDKIIGFAFQYYQEVKIPNLLYQLRYHIKNLVTDNWAGWWFITDEACLGCFQKARCMFCRSQCDSNGKIMFFALWRSGMIISPSHFRLSIITNGTRTRAQPGRSKQLRVSDAPFRKECGRNRIVWAQVSNGTGPRIHGGDFDPNKALLSSLELEKKSIVLISINDNDSVEAGGSHWSLLAWVKSEKKFYHFDSWGNAPSKHAALQTANKISAAIGSPMPVDLRIVSLTGFQSLLQRLISWDFIGIYSSYGPLLWAKLISIT